MSKQLAELFGHLRDCDLKAAAVEIATGLGGGVYPTEVRQSFQLFTRLPCPETAVILIAACPEAAGVIAVANSRFATALPAAMRGAKLKEFDQWIASFDENLRACSSVREFVESNAAQGTIAVGFHRARDQRILFERLSTIGLRKKFFSSGRQFLRDTITKNEAAYRVVADLVCVWGVVRGRERFWNALGQESDAEWHLHSEIQYRLDACGEQFADLAEAFRC